MKTRKKKKNKILISFNLCLVFLLLIGGFLFLESMDDLMIKNLELKSLEEKVNLLQEERREMKTQKNALESSENVSSRLEEMSMVKISNIDYISVGDDSLAKR